MDTISYSIAVITRHGMRMDNFDASTPSSKHGFDIPVGEQVAIVAELEESEFERLFIKFGLNYCHICGKEAHLHMNTFIFLKSHILDAVSALRDHGACEAQAVQFRKDMLSGLAKSVFSDAAIPVSCLSPCVVCGKADHTRTCSGCKLTAYCGRECQKKRWPQHKAVCRARSQAT